MKRRHVALLIVVGLLLGAWAPTLVRSATAKDDAQAKQFAPEADRALVYVYRDKSLLGGDLESQFVVDDAAVATNKAGRFIVVSLSPGTYRLLSISAKEKSGLAMLAHNSKKTPVALTAEAGKLYFFHDVFKSMSGFTLNAVPADEAQAAIAKETLLARIDR